MKLSVLMPVYNEAATILEAVKRVTAVPFPCQVELVIVDDGSTDGTRDLLATIDDERVVLITHEVNAGKGKAIRTAAAAATGDYVVICDADLEYAPEELPAMIAPAIRHEAEVVYGSRTFTSNSAFSFWYVVGNRGVTTFANILFNAYISDLETCFKLMPLSLYRDLDIRSDGFGMEAEITGKLLRRGLRPFEIPISYRARTRAAGKKLTWRDGVEAVAILSRERWRSTPRHTGPTL